MDLIPNNLNIDFIGKRRFFMVLSLALNVAIIVGMAVFGMNWGVDFAGGSELEIKFEKQVDPASIRKTIEGAGFPDATVQEFGPAEDNSFLIHIGRISLLSQEDANKAQAQLKQKFGDDLKAFEFNADQGDKIDLAFRKPVMESDVRGAFDAAGIRLQEVRPIPGGNAEDIAREGRPSWQIITSGIADKVTSALAASQLPKAELRRVEFVGPQVGEELRNKGIFAVIWAALAILIYIAFRFDLRFAPGAVVAMFHDIMIVIGYYLVTRREFNLTSVAVVLTIVGYSVNDTIVIYDRIRENLTKVKGMSLAPLINISINETLSRTILTGFTSMLALIGLLIFGVGQIFDFAAAMFLGIIVGTYSSIYIASPLTIWLEDLRESRAKQAAAAAPGKAS